MALYCPKESCEWNELVRAQDPGGLVDRVCVKPDVKLALDWKTRLLQCESYEEGEGKET